MTKLESAPPHPGSPDHPVGHKGPSFLETHDWPSAAQSRAFRRSAGTRQCRSPLCTRMLHDDKACSTGLARTIADRRRNSRDSKAAASTSVDYWRGSTSLYCGSADRLAARRRYRAVFPSNNHRLFPSIHQSAPQPFERAKSITLEPKYAEDRLQSVNAGT